MNNKCVYLHTNLTTREVFYVGIGTKYKVHSKHRRNKDWYKVVKDCGYEAVVVANELSWDEATMISQMAIKCIGRKDLGEGPLVNKTDGDNRGTREVKNESATAIAESVIKHHGKDGLAVLILSLKKNISYSLIGKNFNVSRQRVHQWAKQLGKTQKTFLVYTDVLELIK